MSFLKHISLSKGAFSLILLIYITSMAVLIPYQYLTLNKKVESEAIEVVKREMSNLQQEMSTAFREGKLRHAENQLLALGLDSDVIVLILLTKNNHIIFSTRMAWKGQAVQDVLPNFETGLFKKTRSNNISEIIFSPNRSEILAAYPVRSQADTKSLRGYKTDILYLNYDVSRAKAAVWYRLIQENILGFLVILIGAILLVIFIHRMASRPLKNLVIACNHKIATAGLKNPVELEGAQEMVQLQLAFNQMSSQLTKTHKALTIKTALYNVLSETNHSIVRTDNAEKLYNDICRIAVEHGSFKLAWIGLIDQTTEKVIPVASQGEPKQYLSNIVISINPKLPEGQGATGQAVRGNCPIVINDLLKTTPASPWRTASLKANIKSRAAIPILIDKKVFGVFNVYADSIDFFTQEIVDLLVEIGLDISFALNNYQRETERRQAEAALAVQRNVLELIAKGVPLKQTLRALCLGIDNLLMNKGGISSILLLEKGKLLFNAGPGLPEAYNQAIDGISIGPNVGSCGTAAFLGKQVIVSDIQTDPLWVDFRSLAKQHDLAACWSTPIKAASSAILGTFAVYYPQLGAPNQQELKLVDRLVHLCALAIERVNAIDQIKQREKNLSVTLNSIGDAVITVDTAGRVTRLNPIAEALTGWCVKTAYGKPLYEVFHIINTQTRITLKNPVEKVIMSGKIMGLANHTSLISKDGTEYHISDSAAPITDENGLLTGVILVFHDVTKQYALQEELRLNHERLSAFHAAFPDLSFVFNEKGVFLEIYGAESKMRHGNREELLGKTISDTIPSQVAKQVMAIIHTTIRTGENQTTEYKLKILDEWRHFEGRTSVLEKNTTTGKGKVTWIARDISEQKQAEEEIEQLAFYDPLTKLPNRRLFLDRLEHECLVVQRHQGSAALMFLDLDHFKTLNDSLGHSIGDSLLEQVAQRLNAQVRGEDTVARIGGDEFVVLLPTLNKEQELAASHAKTVAEKIQMALSAPFFLYEHEHHITASIGITLFSTESKLKAEDILKHADSAMYRAKELGRNRICFYRSDMQVAADTRLQLEKDLRNALKHNQLEPFYQPQVDQHGNCIGLEVLVRWKHAELGMISPAKFIPIAEETGLIIPLGEWILRKSCQQIKQWHDQGLFGKYNQHFSVNISPREFIQDDFIEHVMAILEETKLDPSHLFLEITESMVIDSIDEAIAKMNKLKTCGVRFSMDDFGTGYSSLSYLKRLPIDQLKIDRSFVMDIADDEDDRAIVDVILAVAKQLKLNVVAEGVETAEQANYLTKNGCDIFQGYYFGKPMSAADFELWLTKY